MNEVAQIVHVEGVRVFTMSILVLYLGIFLTKKLPFLKEYNIPSPVTGGFLVSICIGMLYFFGNIQVEFDLALRDIFLIAFFSTIGLSAKFNMLKEGGKGLIILIILASFVLVAQNTAGILTALGVGAHPGYGLMAGSISFAGGHGTSIGYGKFFIEQFGLEKAQEIGLACATFGLIMGGIIGGPIAKSLIKKNNLTGDKSLEAFTPGSDDQSKSGPVTVYAMIDSLFLVGVCIGLGETLYFCLNSAGIMLPRFLTSLFTGIVLTNLVDLFKWKVNANSMSLISDISLELFLAMSLMSLQLWTLFVEWAIWVFLFFSYLFLLSCAPFTIMTVASNFKLVAGSRFEPETLGL